MKFFSAIFIFTCLIVFSPILGVGQSRQAEHKVNIVIPEVALLSLVSEEDRGVILDVLAPGEAGDPLTLSNVQENKGIWINYSSVIRSQNHRRKVVAAVHGEIPVGLNLVVEATEATGTGAGKLGKSAGKVYLSNEQTEVISDIGSCYTGKGASNGHLLNYRLEAVNDLNIFAKLVQTQTTLQVVYTLTDHN